jgi:hypothetical protein
MTGWPKSVHHTFYGKEPEDANGKNKKSATRAKSPTKRKSPDDTDKARLAEEGQEDEQL